MFVNTNVYFVKNSQNNVYKHRVTPGTSHAATSTLRRPGKAGPARPSPRRRRRKASRELKSRTLPFPWRARGLWTPSPMERCGEPGARPAAPAAGGRAASSSCHSGEVRRAGGARGRGGPASERCAVRAWGAGRAAPGRCAGDGSPAWGAAGGGCGGSGGGRRGRLGALRRPGRRRPRRLLRPTGPSGPENWKALRAGAGC